MVALVFPTEMAFYRLRNGVIINYGNGYVLAGFSAGILMSFNLESTQALSKNLVKCIQRSQQLFCPCVFARIDVSFPSTLTAPHPPVHRLQPPINQRSYYSV